MNFHLRKHKKRILSAVLCGSMMLSAGAQALAFDSETIVSSLFDGAQSSTTDLSDSGYALQRLGLVAGGEDGDLMLEKTGSRSEALTLFISLLGERSAATAVSYSYPFRDIPDWFANFAGYGVLEHEGERELVALPEYDLCLGETIEEAVELGKLKNGQYSFIWSPPGASNLPIELIWRVSKSKPARQNVKS